MNCWEGRVVFWDFVAKLGRHWNNTWYNYATIADIWPNGARQPNVSSNYTVIRRQREKKHMCSFQESLKNTVHIARHRLFYHPQFSLTQWGTVWRAELRRQRREGGSDTTHWVCAQLKGASVRTLPLMSSDELNRANSRTEELIHEPSKYCVQNISICSSWSCQHRVLDKDIRQSN